jgi:hypothetical protein
VVSAELLAVSWLETRTEREMAIYPQLIQITHKIIDEAFSEKVITPGITTTDDVVWWFRKNSEIWDWKPGSIHRWMFSEMIRRI